jgi:putative transposase
MVPEEYYKRNLPHWHPVGRSIFITWRLYGSLPQCFRYRQSNKNQKPGHQFLDFDRCLDEASTGPLWLKNSSIAEMIEFTLQKGANDLHHYNLHACAIMANHVHILITPQVPLCQIMKAIKGVTARNANRLLNRTGKVFWQDESFDHWTRDEAEENKIRRYIENNPVKAHLVARPEDWPWSSATSVTAAQAGVPVLPEKT